MRRGSGWIGSLLLVLLLVAVLIGDSDEDGEGPAGRPTTEPRGEHPDGGFGATAPSASAPGSRGVRVRVTGVVDGDTIEVLIGDRTEDVRYIGVDTPETVAPGEPVACFGPQASAFNERLVEGRSVRLVFDSERRDVYGRLLAYVYLGGRFVNAALVKRGFARTLTIPPNDAFAARFAQLEQAAGRAGRGLWGACSP